VISTAAPDGRGFLLVSRLTVRPGMARLGTRFGDTPSDSPLPTIAPCRSRPDGDHEGGQQGKDGYGQRTQGIPNHDVPFLVVGLERRWCSSGMSAWGG
jgi:hypothetical protein